MLCSDLSSSSQQQQQRTSQTTTTSNEQGNVQQHVLSPATAASLVDIEGATIRSFEYLSSSALLQGKERRDALVAWLQLLRTAHPVERCRQGAQQAMTVLDDRGWPSDQDQAVSVKELSAMRICGADTPFKGEWIGCRGSLPESRGYTCGLWQLFHSLSVNIEDTPTASKEWVATIKGFVQHYFQCRECADHFMRFASRPGTDTLQNKKSAVLWMWQAHNVVNARLVIQEKESSNGGGDPAYPKVQWPTNEMCDECNVETERWNEEAVYRFMMKFYHGKGEESRAAVKKSAVSVGGSGLKRKSGWLDAVGLCLIVSGVVYLGLRSNVQQYGLKKSAVRLL